jgi:hypothetical protein
MSTWGMQRPSTRNPKVLAWVFRHRIGDERATKLTRHRGFRLSRFASKRAILWAFDSRDLGSPQGTAVFFHDSIGAFQKLKAKMAELHFDNLGVALIAPRPSTPFTLGSMLLHHVWIPHEILPTSAEVASRSHFSL